MAYGWLATKVPGTQEDGFFIDEDNQIIYWPTKAGPGYIIGPSAAQNIIEAKQKARDSILIVLLFLVWLFIPEISAYLYAMFGVTDLTIERQGIVDVGINSHSEYSIYAFFSGHIGLYSIPMALWIEWRAHRAGDEHLRLSQLIKAPRPPIHYVSPVNLTSIRNIALHTLAVIVLLAMGPIPLITSFYFASHAWEVISFIPLATFSGYFLFLHTRRILLATASRDVRLYDIS